MGYKNNQDVGLEAATIKRVRNSSLVECGRAEDVPGLKYGTEAMDLYLKDTSGRGAFLQGRSSTVRSCGRVRSENAGMSSEKEGENPSHRKPKDS